MKEIYLDNSATTRPLPEVVEAVTRSLTDSYGNPSSLHNKGLAAERIIKSTRETIARRLAVKNSEIFFTSGGTESNNLAIKGIASNYINRGKHLITTRIEHPSVLESFIFLEEEGFEVTFLETDRSGNISLENLAESIRPDTTLVSIFHVNNELGTIQPIDQIGKIIKEKNRNTFFHVDAIQSFGKIYLNPANWQVDLLTISAHKIHGIKGTGALYIRKGIDIKPFIMGGGQEHNLRSGTENVPGIAGFQPAIEALPELTGASPRDKKLDRLRSYLWQKIKDCCPDAIINSPEEGAPHIINVSFPGAKGEILIHGLEEEGIYVSTGSACHSRSHEKSHVLRAVKLPERLIEGAIRISLSHFNTEEELDYAIAKISELTTVLF